MRVTPESAPHLAVALRPSRWLALYVIACHLLAGCGLLFSVLFSALPWPVWGGALVALGGHLYYWFERYLRCTPTAIYFGSGQWHVGIEGRKWPLTLAGEQVTWPLLLVLRGKLGTGRDCILVLPADAADHTDLRRLRILLRSSV